MNKDRFWIFSSTLSKLQVVRRFDDLARGLIRIRWRESGICEIVSIASTPPPLIREGEFVI